ncbi:unnamed protein product [Echinostoma caproni]|uniref:Fibronectin type-III domain-containing protein n=1 Tax=Echinostoma caproni TaxID=27848 RepID=A0A183AJL0_9TREM|nr:unnamed protein product [Echinostoma caproni]
MILSRPDGQPLEQVEMKLINYETNDFLGINATYEIMISPGSGNSTVVRCEYQGRDSRLVYQEKTIFEATQPTKPNTFQNSANLGSMIVYLDSNGQPSATPTNQSSRQTTPTASSWYSWTPAPRPVTIPVHGLMADTKYVFEWSSGNEFGLSAMEQFTLWTKKLEMLPAIYKVTFLKPTVGFLRLSLLLDDPCPYGAGARAELSDLVIRYRSAKEDQFTGSQIGVGEWSEAEVCQLVNPMGNSPGTPNSTESPRSDHFTTASQSRLKGEQTHTSEEEEQSGISWSGNRPITCEFPVPDTQANYEVQVATRNRFDRSEWFTAIYQPALAVHAAAICFPTCGLVGLSPAVHLILFMLLYSIHSVLLKRMLSSASSRVPQIMGGDRKCCLFVVVDGGGGGVFVEQRPSVSALISVTNQS